jgi:hypothetical protein
MTECNNYNGGQLYMGGRRREDDSFPKKKDNFLFARAILTRTREVGGLEV